MIKMAAMERVGVRQLRKNARNVVSDVEQNGPVVVTVNGREAAVMSPPAVEHRWVPAKEEDVLMRIGDSALLGPLMS